MELAFCQRYYENIGNSFFSGSTVNPYTYYHTAEFHVAKRAAATITLFDGGTNNGFPATAPTLTSNTVNNIVVSKVCNATANSGIFSYTATASAEL